MTKNEKVITFLLILVLVLFIFEFVFVLMDHLDYEDRKQAGNVRWEQVEERIEEVEERCDYGRYS